MGLGMAMGCEVGVLFLIRNSLPFVCVPAHSQLPPSLSFSLFLSVFLAPLLLYDAGNDV